HIQLEPEIFFKLIMPKIGMITLLPERQPRYPSYAYQHEDGRVSYPLCFIFSSPVGECLRLDVFMPLLEARHCKAVALLETTFGREESLFTQSAHDKCFHLSSCPVFRG
uniref:Uncharacterized protein n=1 Tax=Amazona collaria TaxID=241587 RepID=A0A8B9FN69_9PSIT